MPKKEKKNGKLKKWQLNTLIGTAAAVVVIGGGVMVWSSTSQSASQESQVVRVTKVTRGRVASSILLSGSVKAGAEQYVYYDATKGDLSDIYVNVGDQVGNGQALAQYSTTDAQANYDAAVRAQERIGRQINELKATGVVTAQAATPASPTAGMDAGAGDATMTGGEGAATATVSPAPSAQDQAVAQRTYDNQLADLQSQYADAGDAVTKALNALNNTTVLSTVDGTVVEVNRDVAKSSTGSSQTIVHVVNNGTLEVEGELSEYNLANLKVGQEVTMTSKVYPDKTWTGQISYISDYPKDASAAPAATSGTGSSSNGAKYPFKVTFTSDIGDLKQGFTINIEVKNGDESNIVPASAVVNEKNKHYVWTLDKNKAKKVEVTLGDADAEKQAITSGLNPGVQVISNPTSELKDGQEVGQYEETN